MINFIKTHKISVMVIFLIIVFLFIFLFVSPSTKDNQKPELNNEINNAKQIGESQYLPREVAEILDQIPTDRQITPDEIVKLFSNNIDCKGGDWELTKTKSSNCIRTVWENLGVSSDLFNENSPPCYVESKEIELNGKTRKETLITIIGSGYWDWQYLIFDKNTGFLDSIDIPFQKYESPQYRVVNGGSDKIWLVIRSLTMSGTGILNYTDQWFKVTDKEVKPALEYPVKGHLSAWLPFDRGYESKVISQSSVGETFSVGINFKVRYFRLVMDLNEVSSSNLFSVSKNVYYIWDKEKEVFIIDDKKSEMNQEQVDGIFGDGNKEFLKHNFDELVDLAENGTELQRKWLSLFLKDIDDNNEIKGLFTQITGISEATE